MESVCYIVSNPLLQPRLSAEADTFHLLRSIFARPCGYFASDCEGVSPLTIWLQVIIYVLTALGEIFGGPLLSSVSQSFVAYRFCLLLFPSSVFALSDQHHILRNCLHKSPTEVERSSVFNSACNVVRRHRDRDPLHARSAQRHLFSFSVRSLRPLPLSSPLASRCVSVFFCYLLLK